MSKINLEKRFQNLVDNVLEYDPSVDINQIIKAWNFTKLAHTGQVVEIIKTKNSKHPSPHWLDFVVTTLARREINRYLRSSEAVR